MKSNFYLVGIHHRFHCPAGKNYWADLQIGRLFHPCMCICSNHLPQFLIDSTNNYKIFFFLNGKYLWST